MVGPPDRADHHTTRRRFLQGGLTIVASGAIGLVSGDSPFVDVSNLSPESATVAPGVELTVSADVHLLTDVRETQDIICRIEEEPVEGAVQTVTLDPDERETVTFEITVPEEPGEYEYGVYSEDTRDRGTLVVESPEFQLSEFELSRETVGIGEEISISAEVTNEGVVTGTNTVELWIDETELWTEELTLDSNESESVSLDFNAPDDEGEYTFGIRTADSKRSRDLTVLTSPPDSNERNQKQESNGDNTANQSTDEHADDDGAGFGVVSALLGSGAVGYLLQRLQHEES